MANRRGVIVLKQKNGEAKTEVVVNQKSYGKANLVLTTKKVTITSAAQQVEAFLEIKTSGGNVTANPDVDWITQTGNTSTVTENKGKSSRIGRVIFKELGSSAVDTMVITQLSAELSDGTSRATDSVAVIAVLNELAKVNKEFTWPSGQSITTKNNWFYTAEINGEQRIVHFQVDLSLAYIYDNIYADLSPSIWKLTKLKRLILHGSIMGKMSEDLGKMTSLEELNIYAFIGGDIPKSIKNLKFLKHLGIEAPFSNEMIEDKINPVTSIPEEIGELSALKVLYLTTSVARLPKSIVNLSNMIELIIAQTDKFAVDFLPESMDKLQNLQLIDVRTYSLPKYSSCNVPAGIFNASLVFLSIDTDSPMPARIANSNLRSLLVTGNYTSLLPVGARMPQTLNALGLYSPKLTELTDEMLSSNLEMLQIYTDALTTMSPKLASLTKLTDIMWLNIAGSKKDFPIGLCKINSLKKLSILGVKGKLPEEITNLTNLTHFQLLSWDNGNDLEGVISDNQWKFFLKNLGSKLSYDAGGVFRLAIRKNRFTGTIPDFILKSDSWTTKTSPTAGYWDPSYLIIPQQPGYGFANFPESNNSSSKSNVQGKTQPKRNQKGVYQMMSR